MTLLIATKNKGKLAEYISLLSAYSQDIRSLFDYPTIGDIEENMPTFQENALIKASVLYEETHLPTIADDSGLMVEALNQEPGVHSKRFSESGHDDDNNQLLLKRLNGIEHRNATFISVICYYERPDSIHFFVGTTQGIIGTIPKGQGGFGYDPLFYVPELKKTYAEMTLNEKNQVSHRKKAADQLIAFFEVHHVVNRL